MDGIARDSVTVYPDGRLRARAVNVLWISVELRRAFAASIVWLLLLHAFFPPDRPSRSRAARTGRGVGIEQTTV